MKALFLALALSLTFTGALADEAMKVGAAGKVFKTSDGVYAAIVPLEPAGSKKFLVRFTGTTSEHEGRVFLAEMDDSGTDRADFATYDISKDRYVIVTKRSGSYEGYIPGVKDSFRLSFDERRSDVLTTAELLTAYKSQKPLPGAGKKKAGK